MLLPVQGEGSSFALTVEVFDELDQPVIPATIEYRIDCMTNKRTMRDWTSITPGTEMELSVAPADNEILTDRHKRELRQLTIRLNDDASNQMIDPDPLQWYVANVLPGRKIVP